MGRKLRMSVAMMLEVMKLEVMSVAWVVPVEMSSV